MIILVLQERQHLRVDQINLFLATSFNKRPEIIVYYTRYWRRQCTMMTTPKNRF